MSRNVIAVLWLLSAGLQASFINAFIKQAGADIHVFQLTFLRGLFAVIMLLPFVLLNKNGGWRILATKKLKLHIYRIIVGAVSIPLFFYGLIHMQLAEAVTISFSRPMFVFILAVMFLSEKADFRCALATFAGFIGVVIVMRPDVELINLGGVFVLISALCTAFFVLFLKKLTETESTLSLVFWFAAGLTVTMAVPALCVWKPLDADITVLLLGAALLGNTSQYCMAKAYHIGEVTVITPFDYFQILFAAVHGVLFFSEMPDIFLLAGAVIITVSTIYILHRRRG